MAQIAVILAACAHHSGEWYELDHSPLIVGTPQGMVRDTAVYTDFPSLHFSLPEGADGSTPLFPSISVEQLPAALEPKSVADYADQIVASPHATVFIGPDSTTILGNPALEVGAERTTIFDFHGGGAGTARTTVHEIIFQVAGRYYVCTLEAYPEIHGAWVSEFRKWCHGAKLSKSE